MALSNRQKAWLAAYLGESGFNATAAARVAGYKDPEVSGWENKQKPEIQAAIARRLNAAAMSAEEVLRRLADQARGIGEYVRYEVLEADGYGKQQVISLDWDRLKAEGKLHLVKGWEWEKTGLNILFTDPQAALIQIGRHHKLFTDRVEQIDPDIDQRIEAELEKLEAAREAALSSAASGA